MASDEGKAPELYQHGKHAGNFADVMKHVVLHATISELQKEHPDGLMIADMMAGRGLYEISTLTSGEWKPGIGRILKRFVTAEKIYEIPKAVRDYVKGMLAAVGSTGFEDFDFFPGSSVLAQSMMRKVDSIRVVDKYVADMEGLLPNTKIKQLDAFNPITLDFAMPKKNQKHNVILIDPAYTSIEEYGQTKQLLSDILDRNPLATVLVWLPFIQDHRFRWSHATALRDICKEKAKRGRYYSNIVIRKTGLQGCGMVIANPTPLFDDVVDPKALHYMAHVMNDGKDEYTVEQFMKKKKKKPEDDF